MEASVPKPLIYVAAPYSDPDPAVIEARMAVVTRYMARAVMRGELVVSPLLFHYALQHEPALGADWDTWQVYSETLLIQCAEMRILCLPGWEESAGVSGEFAFAQRHGIPVKPLPRSVWTFDD